MNTKKISLIEDSYYKAASVDLTEGYFVKMSADDKITPVTAATDLAIGLCMDDTAREDVKVKVMLLGVAEAIAGGNCTRGTAAIMTTAGAVTNASLANAERIVGMFLESATSGNRVRMLVFPNFMPAS